MRRRPGPPVAMATSPSPSARGSSSRRCEATSRPVKASETAVRHPPLILIVDDNADNREILEARLTSQGYSTATPIDGEEALAVARELLPDLILLDVMMPKLDGLEVCRQLRTDPTY